MPVDKKIQDGLKQLAEYHKQIDPLPTDEKIKLYNEIKKQKSDLEEKVSDLDTKLIVFENSQDILEYNVRKNEAALDLFDYIKKHSRTTYKTFTKQFDEDEKMIIDHILLYLQSANLIIIHHNQKTKSEEFTISKIGKKFEYTLKKD